MPNPDVVCLAELDLSPWVLDDWDYLQQVLVDHHGDAPRIAGHED